EWPVGVVDKPHVQHERRGLVGASTRARAALSVVAVEDVGVDESHGHGGRVVEADVGVLVTDSQRPSDLRAVHPAARHDEHRPDQLPALLPVVVDERLDVIRIQDIGVDHVPRVDVVHDLEIGRLHGYIADSDGGPQVGVPPGRGASFHDQPGRRLQLRRRRLAGRRDAAVRMGWLAGGRPGPLDGGRPAGDVSRDDDHGKRAGQDAPANPYAVRQRRVRGPNHAQHNQADTDAQQHVAGVAEGTQAFAVRQARVQGVQVGVERQAAEQGRDPQQPRRQKSRRPPQSALNSTTLESYLSAELDFREPKFKTEDGVAGPSGDGEVRRRRTLAPGNREEGDGCGEGKLWVRAFLEPCFVGGGMTRLSFFRSLAVALGASSVVAACGGGNAPSEQLAADQTMSFPMVNEFADLDPGHMSAAQDIDAFRNVYSGLYKFDDQLNEVPDIATGAPKISDDQKTYTFTMRKDVKFSNGDPVKADDFIF